MGRLALPAGRAVANPAGNRNHLCRLSVDMAEPALRGVARNHALARTTTLIERLRGLEAQGVDNGVK
jgi:hypothetical protein